MQGLNASMTCPSSIKVAFSSNSHCEWTGISSGASITCTGAPSARDVSHAPAETGMQGSSVSEVNPFNLARVVSILFMARSMFHSTDRIQGLMHDDRFPGASVPSPRLYNADSFAHPPAPPP